MNNFHWLTGVVIPYANMALFLFLAIKILKGPFLGALTGKRNDFVSKLKEANLAKEEAEKRYRELSQKMSSLTAEIEEIKSKARRQGEEEASRLLEEAETLASHLRKEADRVSKNELEKARDYLRSELLKGVKKEVLSQLEKELDIDRQKQLVHDQFGSLNSLKGV